MKNQHIILLIFLTLIILSTGCLGEGNREYGLTGAVKVDGSSTVFPITEAIGEEFQILNPYVKVTIGISGTGGGFKKFCSGETDISDASRQIKQSEIDACRENEIEYIELPVAFDGLSVVTNPENSFVDCLTTEELNKIWKPESAVKYWSQVRDEWPEKEIKLFGAGTDSGTFDYFTKVINGEEGASRSDYTASEDDNVLVQGIAGEKNSLGYFGFAYYTENKDKIKLVAIDGEAGCISPTETTINDGTYSPLSRPVYIYVNTESLNRTEISEFVKFYMQNANLLVPDVGYIPLPDSQYQENLEKAGLVEETI